MSENKSFSSAKIEVRGIAQLGERLNGIQEVSGSIPLISTKKKDLCSRQRVYKSLFYPQ